MSVLDGPDGQAMNVTFRGGCVEDESGAKWWSAELLAKVEKERDEARAKVTAAYRRGAEAMREACAREAFDYMDAGNNWPAAIVRDILRALPIPEER